MTEIIPSTFQLANRSLFKQAVAFAKEIYKHADKKQAWQKKLGIKTRLFNALIKFWLVKIKKQQANQDKSINRIVQKCFHRQQAAGISFSPLIIANSIYFIIRGKYTEAWHSPTRYQ